MKYPQNTDGVNQDSLPGRFNIICNDEKDEALKRMLEVSEEINQATQYSFQLKPRICLTIDTSKARVGVDYDDLDEKIRNTKELLSMLEKLKVLSQAYEQNG